MQETEIPRREQIVFGEAIDWENDAFGGVHQFQIDVETAQQCIDEGYLDPNETQNASPTAHELVTFGSYLEGAYKVDVNLQGYMVSPQRRDSRISITTINVHPVDHLNILPEGAYDEFRRAFGENAHIGRPDAYTLDAEHGHAWWD